MDREADDTGNTSAWDALVRLAQERPHTYTQMGNYVPYTDGARNESEIGEAHPMTQTDGTAAIQGLMSEAVPSAVQSELSPTLQAKIDRMRNL